MVYLMFKQRILTVGAIFKVTYYLFADQSMTFKQMIQIEVYISLPISFWSSSKSSTDDWIFVRSEPSNGRHPFERKLWRNQTFGIWIFKINNFHFVIFLAGNLSICNKHFGKAWICLEKNPVCYLSFYKLLEL